MEIKQLLSKPENEIVEFKLAENDYDFWKICNYVSALANEANLKDSQYGYLILWVEPKKHSPVGTNYRKKNLQSVKYDVFRKTNHSINVSEEYIEGKRLVVIQVPESPQWCVITSSNFAYAREWESLVALSDIKRESILSQVFRWDWSAKVIEDANVDDLDVAAIQKARENFTKKNSHIPKSEIDSWKDIEFLNRASLTKDGNITRTALLLLWKESSSYKIDGVSQIAWILRDKDNFEKDYEHFYPPFILNVEKIFSKIRNLKYRYLQEWTIFPDEVEMYDVWVLRELLHNCIAHQDYKLQSRINLVEYEDGKIIFDNAGDFIPESIDSLIVSESPPKIYRNPFLTKAMREINMIDTIGSGIKRVYKTQKERFFPLPSYSFDNHSVKVELYGRIVDMKYANILAQHTELTLQEIILLDKIQKKKTHELNKQGVQELKKKGFIEGRYPNVFIGSNVSWKIGKQTEYMKLKGFDDEYYSQMILEYLEKYKKAHKQEIKDLLWNKLPDILTEEQKEDKIRNLLNVRLAKKWVIKSIPWKTGSIKDRVWIKN